MLPVVPILKGIGVLSPADQGACTVSGFCAASRDSRRECRAHFIPGKPSRQAKNVELVERLWNWSAVAL
jgi:hypothetical protein